MPFESTLCRLFLPWYDLVLIPVPSWQQKSYFRFLFVTSLLTFKVIAHAGPRLSRELPFGPVPAKTLRKEYSSLECAIELVDDVDDAIAHIESHGSSHTDAIITENGSFFMIKNLHQK